MVQRCGLSIESFSSTVLSTVSESRALPLSFIEHIYFTLVNSAVKDITIHVMKFAPSHTKFSYYSLISSNPRPSTNVYLLAGWDGSDILAA